MIDNKTGMYSAKELIKRKAMYRVVYGGRNTGKSYQVKAHLLEDAVKNGRLMGYIRRWQEDDKAFKCESYFADMAKEIKRLTKNKCCNVKVKNDAVYLVGIDGKITDGILIGYKYCLAHANKYKSLNYLNVKNFVLEEFQDETNRAYHTDELHKFNSIISTVSRLSDDIEVWLIGNTLDRSNPYFCEWGLEGIVSQEVGTIDRYEYKYNGYDGQAYTVTIDVEKVPETEKSTQKLFVGGNRTISGGEWKTQEMPKLVGNIKDYDCIYKLAVKGGLIWYVVNLLLPKDGTFPIVYVYPYTKKYLGGLPQRQIRDDYSVTDHLQTKCFLKSITAERKIMTLIDTGSACFSDNLTGTEFTRIYQKLSVRSMGGR